MNTQKACDILELNLPFSLKELKHNYHLQALKYHPDKNKTENSKDKFIEINDAYEFLHTYLEVQNETHSSTTSSTSSTSSTSDTSNAANDYLSFMKRFINSTNISHESIEKITELFSHKTYDISMSMFKQLNKDTAIQIYEYFVQYRDIFNMKNSLLQEMENIIREKVKDNNIILLNPTIDNLFNEDIYKLDHQNDTYYIPLWHNEISYDISNSTLIVKCIPSLPEYISLDSYNNVHINIKSSIHTALSKDILPITCGGKVFEIPVSKLNIKKYQTYILYNKGISTINTKELFNASKKSNIYIHIELH